MTRPGNPGVRARDPDALAKITQARAARHAAEIVASADAWLPTVRRLYNLHVKPILVAINKLGGVLENHTIGASTPTGPVIQLRQGWHVHNASWH